MSSPEPLINDAVIEVLQKTLHTTADEELQGAIWQTLAGIDFLINQVDAVRWIVKP